MAFRVGWLLAGVEGCLVMVLLALAGSFISTTIREQGFPQAAEPAKAATTLIVFLLCYGRRFYPTLSLDGAVRELLFAIGKSFRDHLLPASALPLALCHIAQIGYTLYQFAAVPDMAQALRCGSPAAVIWNPIVEELMFRYAVMLVVMQRAGGDARFGCVVSTCMWGAIHAGNLLTAQPAAVAGAEDSVVADVGLITTLQILLAWISGSAYSLLFVTNGIAPSVLLHVTNNLVAVLWAAAGAGSGPSCVPVIDARLLASLMLQVMATTATAVMAYRDIRATAASKDKNS